MFILNTIKSIKQTFPKENSQLVKQIIQESNLFISEKILKGDEYILPHNIGVILIVKFKNQTVFDYIHFCKTGEYKKQNNMATFNYIYKILWTKGLLNRTKKSLTNNIYKFNASRYKIKRPLAKILQSGKDFYKDEEYILKFRNININTSYVNKTYFYNKDGTTSKF